MPEFTPQPLTPDDAKWLAAAKALELVTPGMRLGLGTGTTAAHFVTLLGARVAEGLDVICVPTSERTRHAGGALFHSSRHMSRHSRHS